MEDRVTRPKIFIYCDDPSHPNRRVAVINYVSIGEGRWTERFTSTAVQGNGGTGVTLVNDARIPRGALINDPEGVFRGKDVRSRYQPECRKCRRPVTAREENLFAVLNAFAAAGVRDFSLSVLAASLQRQSEAGGADPEPGQG